MDARLVAFFLFVSGSIAIFAVLLLFEHLMGLV
jgi:hypothetical protein